VTIDRPSEYLAGLVRKLCKLPAETEWTEFKVNNAQPREIGEYISALSNSAALAGQEFAFLVWGVVDSDHAIVGTTFAPRTTKEGNEELENWLSHHLAPTRIDFRFFEVEVDGKSVVVLKIPRAYRYPVQFQNVPYIRIGSYKKKLKDYPDKERSLWQALGSTPFESGVVADQVSDNDVLRLLEYPSYFDLLERPLPANRDQILEALADEGLIRPCDAGDWDITNLGGILFARRLEDFDSLKRKAMRIIQYSDASRVSALRERVESRGYACGFESLISFISGLLPLTEVIEQSLRKTVPCFPALAVRELVANALIHQDFVVTGSGPMVEIFADRVEITNPGAPLMDTQRFVDAAPRSRRYSAGV